MTSQFFEHEASSDLERRWQAERTQGLHFFRQGQSAQAERHLASALELARELGPDDPRLARSLGELAEVRRAQGDLEKAEELVKQSLEIFEARGEHFHPNIVPSLNNLAGYSYAQGKHPMADALYRRALQIWDETGQAPHQRLIPILFNLATLCRQRDDLIEARSLMQRACDTADLVLGKDHPDTLKCRRALQDMLIAGARS